MAICKKKNVWATPDSAKAETLIVAAELASDWEKDIHRSTKAFQMAVILWQWSFGRQAQGIIQKPGIIGSHGGEKSELCAPQSQFPGPPLTWAHNGRVKTRSDGPTKPLSIFQRHWTVMSDRDDLGGAHCGVTEWSNTKHWMQRSYVNANE